MKNEEIKVDIIKIFREFENEIDFKVTVVETILSTVIIIEDKESQYEEVVTISDAEVHIISEGCDYTKLTLDNYYAIVKENYE